MSGSENFFKETMSCYNFDYHPGYDIKELEEQPLADNPEVKIIKKTIKGIKQKMDNWYLKNNVSKTN